MDPPNFRFFSKIIQKCEILLPFVPNTSWKPPRTSPGAPNRPQEIPRSLQKSPLGPLRGLQEASPRPFLWQRRRSLKQCHGHQRSKIIQSISKTAPHLATPNILNNRIPSCTKTSSFMLQSFGKFTRQRCEKKTQA